MQTGGTYGAQRGIFLVFYKQAAPMGRTQVLQLNFSYPKTPKITLINLHGFCTSIFKSSNFQIANLFFPIFLRIIAVRKKR
jgi:hypothetical protein